MSGSLHKPVQATSAPEVKSFKHTCTLACYSCSSYKTPLILAGQEGAKVNSKGREGVDYQHNQAAAC